MKKKRQKDMPLFTFVKEYRYYFYGMLIIIIGVVFGSISAKKSNISLLSEISQIFDGFIDARGGALADPSILLSSFLSNFKLVLLAFVLGLTVVGIPGHIGILFYKGFSLGFSISYVSITYGINGLLLSLCCIFISAVISCFALIFASVEGIKFSKSIVSAVFGTSSKNVPFSKIGMYTLKFLFCTVLVLVAAVADFIISPILLKLLIYFI